MPLAIQDMRPADWEEVGAIYAQGIATGSSTFETEVPSWDAWDAAHLRVGRLVATDAGQVVGWAALSPVSSRCIYAGVAEVSIYIDERHRGRGIGAALMGALIEASERGGIWTLEAGMFPENTASAALHRRFGFREIGRRDRIGKLGDRWRDTVLFERRSAVTGV